MAEVRIKAEKRTRFGKGAARKIRREHKVPAVLYGHGTETRHLTLPGHDLMIALRTPNVLIRLEGDGINEIALPKGVQRDPIKGFLEHVDLLLVKRGERVTVELPVVVTGEPVSDGVLDQQMVTVSIEAEATHIPQNVEVNVDGFEIGHAVHASDLKLPTGATLLAEPDALVLHILPAQGGEAPAEGEGEGEAAAAEAAAE
ncbi:50S ribosomal protein L25/general stress protein Ctc [Thermopolyspora sp. NPDC052614]|uniref:50S ribosomal protein L25/general stress protein Ctc n=1 Tax=Thermopolyspora sp. NPDC052614 TaxID=3155682 RepID=UPI003427E6F8